MSEKNPSASKATDQRQEKKAAGSRDIKDCFGETPKPARESRALPKPEDSPTVLVGLRVLRLRRVSAVRRLRLLDHREDLRQGLRGYRARRMTRDDWPVLCVTRRFVRL